MLINKKFLIAARVLALLLLIGASWAVLSFVEGWIGVLLWAIVAVPLCLALEALLQASAARPKKSHSLPRMAMRTPQRGPETGALGSTPLRRPDPFHWGPGAERARKRARDLGPSKPA